MSLADLTGKPLMQTAAPMKLADSIHRLFYPHTHRTRRSRERREFYLTIALALPLVAVVGVVLYALQDRLAQ